MNELKNKKETKDGNIKALYCHMQDFCEHWKGQKIDIKKIVWVDINKKKTIALFGIKDQTLCGGVRLFGTKSKNIIKRLENF